MKKIILLIIALLVLSFQITSSYAFDGELYFGKFLSSDLNANPDGGTAKFIGGIEIGHKMRFLRPYVKLETLMDAYSREDQTFHPSSIKYDLGTKILLPKGIYFEISHMCWHPIDSKGTVEQYNLFKIGIKFH